MRWLIYLFSLFVTIDMIIIAYWQDSQASIDLNSILFYLLGLPLLVFTISYTASLIYRQLRRIKTESTHEEQSIDLAAQFSSEHSTQVPVYLKVHATALQTSEGDDPADILNALKNYKAAQLDPELVNALGVYILSRRIDISEDEFKYRDLIETDDSAYLAESASPRFKRIGLIVQRLLQTLEPQLCLLSEGMAQASQWHARPDFEQPVLHPAWNGQRDQHITQHTEQVINQMQQWPAQLQISCFLPQSWDEQDQQLITHIVNHVLQQLEFNSDQYAFNPTVLDAELSQQKLLEQLFEKIKQDEHNIYLVLGADSILDQEEVDDIIWGQPNYIAAEAGYGLLLSHQNIAIPTLEEISYLHINPNKNNLINLKEEDKTEFISPINPLTHTHQIRKLSNHLNNLKVEVDDLLFTGSLLEYLDSQSIGLGLTLSAALTQQMNNSNCLFLQDQGQAESFWFLTKNLNLAEQAND